MKTIWENKSARLHIKAPAEGINLGRGFFILSNAAKRCLHLAD